MFNILLRQRLGVFADVYRADTAYRANSLLGSDGRVQNPACSHSRETQAEVIAKLIDRGVIP